MLTAGFRQSLFFVERGRRGGPKFSTEPGLAVRPIRRNIGRAGLIKILLVGRLSGPARCKNRIETFRREVSLPMVYF